LVVWLISFVVEYLVGKILWLVFYPVLRQNEQRRYLLTQTHKQYMRNTPFMFSGWTYNRILFYQLVVSWLIVLFGIYGILVAERIYTIIIATPVGAILIFFMYRPTLMNWTSSFIARFLIHYYDILRIGEQITYKKELYVVIDIMVFSTKLKKINLQKDEKPKEIRMKPNRHHKVVNMDKFSKVSKNGYICVQNHMFIDDAAVLFWWDSVVRSGNIN